MVRESQDGLEWDDTGLDLVPRWTREPSLEAIERVCRQQLDMCPEDTCTVSFYAAGAFNRLYLVSTSDNNPLLIRVSLPMHPHFKIRGEVATLHWVRDNTNIPVLRVIAFQDTNDNEIRFEWMLMEMMPGTTAYRRWRTMSMEQKVAFTEQFATKYLQQSVPNQQMHLREVLGHPPCQNQSLKEIAPATVAGPTLGPSDKPWTAAQIKADLKRKSKL